MALQDPLVAGGLSRCLCVRDCFLVQSSSTAGCSLTRSDWREGDGISRVHASEYGSSTSRVSGPGIGTGHQNKLAMSLQRRTEGLVRRMEEKMDAKDEKTRDHCSLNKHCPELFFFFNSSDSGESRMCKTNSGCASSGSVVPSLGCLPSA